MGNWYPKGLRAAFFIKNSPDSNRRLAKRCLVFCHVHPRRTLVVVSPFPQRPAMLQTQTLQEVLFPIINNSLELLLKSSQKFLVLGNLRILDRGETRKQHRVPGVLRDLS